MAAVQTGRFPCGSCGRSYRWKPELAGKKVKCKCGQVMLAPKQMPGVSETEQDDDLGLYDLVSEPEPPTTRAAPPVEAPPPSAPSRKSRKGAAAVPTIKPMPQASSTRMTSPMMAYAGTTLKAKQEAIEATAGGPLWKEIYLPAALVLLGMAMQVGLITGWRFALLANFLTQLGVQLGINLVLSFIGVLIVAKLMEINFGSPGPMVLKLAAIALLVPAVAQLLGGLIGSDSYFVAMMVSGIIQMFLGVAAFMWLFGIDMNDAFFCVVVIWLVNQWAVMFLAGLILSNLR